MIKITTNYAKTQLPLKRIKGTAEERLQMALDMNKNFYQSLKEHFDEKGAISQTGFSRKLKKTIGAPIQFDIADSKGIEKKSDIYMTLDFKTITHDGYTLFVPINWYTGKIERGTASVFLRATMKLFDRITNPKYNRRTIILDNKHDNKAAKELINNTLLSKNELNAKQLNEVLKSRTLEDQINILQLMRYTLQLEEHSRLLPIDPKELTITFHNYHFAEKIKLIEETLAATLQKARAQK